MQIIISPLATCIIEEIALIEKKYKFSSDKFPNEDNAISHITLQQRCPDEIKMHR
jgi:hypothetical protein